MLEELREDEAEVDGIATTGAEVWMKVKEDINISVGVDVAAEALAEREFDLAATRNP